MVFYCSQVKSIKISKHFILWSRTKETSSPCHLTLLVVQNSYKQQFSIVQSQIIHLQKKRKLNSCI